MNIFIIAIMKFDPYNKKINGYRLLDIDDNNKVMDVTREQLINVLKSKKIKIQNAKYSDGNIVGKYYSLQKLPMFNDLFCENDKLSVLYIKDDRYVTISDAVGNTKNVLLPELRFYKNVINIIDNRILCKNINEQGSSESDINEQLNREAENPNVVWNMDSFSRYMRMHNWRFSVINIDTAREVNPDTVRITDKVKINKISKECNIVHLPFQCVASDLLFDGQNNNVNTIILGPQFEKIWHISSYGSSASCYGLKSTDGLYGSKITIEALEEHQAICIINNLYIQSSSKITDRTLDLCGIQQVIINNVIKIPACKKLKDSFNNSIINGIEFCEGIEEIRNSFNKTVLVNGAVYTKGVTNICESFVEVQGASNIKIGATTGLITTSFVGTSISNVDFTEAVELSRITYAFNSSNLVYLDMTPAIKLKSINNSFNTNECLSKVKLPYLLNFLVESFNFTNMERLELNASIVHIEFPVGERNSEPTTVIFHEETRDLTASMLHNYYSGISKVDISNIKIIQDNAIFKDISFKESIPNDILYIGSGALSGYITKTFDFREYEHITEVSDALFSNNDYIGTLIISGNVRKIGHKILNKALGIKNIVIGENVEVIENDAFTGMATDANPTFYVVKNSYAETKFNKSKKRFTVVVMGSEDEIYNTLYGDISDASQAKYRLILGDSEYKDLLKEPFVNYINKSYKMIVDLKQNDRQAPARQLDTSRFRELSIQEYPSIATSYYGLGKTVQQAIDDKSGNLTNLDVEYNKNARFIGMCNLITTIFKRDDRLYSEQFIKSANINNISNETCIHISKNYAIIIASAKLSIETKSELSILMIIIGNNIVFQTPFSTKQLLQLNKKDSYGKIILYHISHYKELTRDRMFKSIGKYMQIGDSIDFVNNKIGRINSSLIPARYFELINSALLQTYTFIGVNGIIKGNKPAKALFYDAINQEFLMTDITGEAVDNYNDVCPYKFQSIDTLVVTDKVSFDELPELEYGYFEDFYRANKSELLNTYINISSMNKEEIDDTFNSDKYKPDGNKMISLLARYMYDNNINSISSIQPGFISALEKMGWVKPVNMTIERCENIAGSANKSCVCNKYDIEGTDKKLVQYSIELKGGNGYRYIVGEVDSNTNKKKRSGLYVARTSLSNMIKTLYILGSSCCTKTSKYNGISNIKIDTDDFVFLTTLAFDEVNVYNDSNIMSRDGIKINIALDRYNCDIYLIGEQFDMDYILLYRFDSFSDLDKFVSEIENISTMCDVYDNAKLGIKDSVYAKMREHIMLGYSDSYPYPFSWYEKFRLLKKQPKDRSNEVGK